jgi:hypothetical protein
MQGMKYVGVLRHRLVSLLPQSRPYRVLVIIFFDMVELLLEGINKGFPSGFSLETHRFIHGVPLPVTFPHNSNMGKGFKECEGDIFHRRFFLERILTL